MTIERYADRFVAAALGRLARTSEAIYEWHADRCAVCCVLGGEFCHTGLELQQMIDTLESAPTR